MPGQEHRCGTHSKSGVEYGRARGNLEATNHVVLDDLYDEDANSKEFLDLVIAGRHRNIHLIVLRRNLFQQSEYSKTIDLNVTQIVLFNCPRDFGTSIGRAFHFIESV